MFRRRRPVMRMAAGAATAGVAYHMGKGSGERQAEQDQYNEQAASAYAATQQPAAPPPAAAAAPSETDQLDHLVQLHNSGALSDDEFTAAKAKLLGI